MASHHAARLAVVTVWSAPPTVQERTTIACALVCVIHAASTGNAHHLIVASGCSSAGATYSANASTMLRDGDMGTSAMRWDYWHQFDTTRNTQVSSVIFGVVCLGHGSFDVRSINA